MFFNSSSSNKGHSHVLPVTSSSSPSICIHLCTFYSASQFLVPTRPAVLKACSKIARKHTQKISETHFCEHVIIFTTWSSQNHRLLRSCNCQQFSVETESFRGWYLCHTKTRLVQKSNQKSPRKSTQDLPGGPSGQDHLGANGVSSDVFGTTPQRAPCLLSTHTFHAASPTEGQKKQKTIMLNVFKASHLVHDYVQQFSFNEFPDLEACIPLSPFQPVWLSAHLWIPRSRATRSNKVDSIGSERSVNSMNIMLPLPLKKAPCPHWIYFTLPDATFAS